MMPSPDTGLAHALATLAQAPDPTAWALVLERAGPAMEALARRLTGDGELARDAVQEALLQIRDSAGAFRAPPGTAGCQPAEGPAAADRAACGWILRVTANTALLVRRGHARRQRRDRSAAMPDSARSLDVDHGLATAELAEQLRCALAALPEPTRAAIVLRHCSGLSFGDVATALGIPEGTAKVRVHRGLSVLRERLTRAGLACSLLAIGGLLERLPASGMPMPFASTAAARHLLTRTTTSSLAGIHSGVSMTTLVSLMTATAILAIGGVSLLLSQERVTTAPPATPAPPVATTPAPLAQALPSIRISPLPITADAAAMGKLATATKRAWNGGATWGDRLDRTDGRGFELRSWTSSATLERPCPVAVGADWRTTLDALAKDAGLVWRMRGTAAEFLTPTLARMLATPLDGRQAPTGTRTAVLAWFAEHAGLTPTLHPSLGVDDGKRFDWSPQSAAVEAWLDGLAQAMQATALLSFDGAVVFYRPPAVAPLDHDPEFIISEPRLTYQAPPAPRLSTEVSFQFSDAGLAYVAEQMAEALRYPVEVDPQVLQAGAPLVTLSVQDMQLRYVAHYVARLTDLEVEVQPDRLRLTRGKAAAAPASDRAPALPIAPQ